MGYSLVFTKLLFIPLFIFPSTFYAKSVSWGDSASVKFAASLFYVLVLCKGLVVFIHQELFTFHNIVTRAYFHDLIRISHS